MTLTDEPVREGGLAAWAPRITPPIGVDLTPEQALACAFRILAEHRLQREHRRAHHLVDGDDGDDARQPVGPVVGRGQGVRRLRGRPRRQRARRQVGRHAGDPHPHRAAPPPRRRPRRRAQPSVLRRPCSPRSGMLPEIVHQTGVACSTATSRSSTSTTARSTTPSSAPTWPRQIGDASVVDPRQPRRDRHRPDDRGGDVQGGDASTACAGSPTTSMLLGQASRSTIAPGFGTAMKASLLERAADVYWAGAVRMLLRDEPEVLD